MLKSTIREKIEETGMTTIANSGLQQAPFLLDTTESRKTLTSHLDDKTRTLALCISFTTSAAAVQELANMRAHNGNRCV